MKRNALSLYHLKVGSLPKQFDNFKYLINQLQIEFDFIGIADSRLIKGISPTTNINLNDYVIEHTPIESSAAGAFLYVQKKCSYPGLQIIFQNLSHMMSGKMKFRQKFTKACRT